MKIKLLVKAALLLLTDEKTQKRVKTIVGVVLSPLLVIVLFLGGFGSASSDHNHAVVRAVFNQTPVSDSVPAELKMQLELLQDYFGVLNEKITTVESEITEGTLNKTTVRSLFFSTYFNKENLSLTQETIHQFVDCFVVRTEIQSVEEETEGDNEEDSEPVVEVVVIQDMHQVYENLRSRLGITLDEETLDFARQIAQIVDYGATASNEGEGKLLSILLEDYIDASLKTDYVGGNLKSPFDFDWRSVITSEYGPRDPIVLPDGSVTSNFHSGIDFGVGLGTPIQALNGGTVIMVRNYESGLGYFLVVDHGGGVMSVYGHCSRILVSEGDQVSQGQTIAEVGSTGYSTGNHLHLEIWENGKTINPRSRLE